MRAVTDRTLRTAVTLTVVLALGAAGDLHAAPRPQDLPPGAAAVRNAVVLNALTVMEDPYRWGGEQPGGFDCSGLVHYAYSRAGLEVPRTTEDQARHRRDSELGELVPGDLVFFRIGGVDHVGIYVGEQRMVHAPSAGGQIRVERIDKRYWQRRYAGATSAYIAAR